MPVKCGLNSEVAATQRLGIAGVHCSSVVISFSALKLKADVEMWPYLNISI